MFGSETTSTIPAVAARRKRARHHRTFISASPGDAERNVVLDAIPATAGPGDPGVIKR